MKSIVQWIAQQKSMISGTLLEEASGSGISETIIKLVNGVAGDVMLIISGTIVTVTAARLGWLAYHFVIGGNEGIEKSKKEIKYLVVGFVVALSAAVIVASLKAGITKYS